MGLGDAETVLARKNANFVIDEAAAEAGLVRSIAAPGPFGMRRHEAAGGRLTLTPAVLWFRAHPFNFVRPTFGIPLDSIAELHDTSRNVSRQMQVVLQDGQRLTFVIWGVRAFIERIDQARAAL